MAEGLTNKRAAMIAYAVKLTKTPADVCSDDVQSLKSVGFTDIDVLHIAEATAYFAYVNRLADGLGVSVEVEDDA